jgi:7,8-dihydroneopterin aldolase/epimerase/oxygenase
VDDEAAEPLDRLAVTGIEAYGHHGVLAAERRDGQLFSADVVLVLDTRSAADSDDLQDTVDYGTLVLKVKQAIESDPVDLIETLAQRLADICLDDPRVRRAEVTLHKPGAPIEATFTDVTLTITRSSPRTPSRTRDTMGDDHD